MVTIDKEDFNQDMDDYLTSRRDKPKSNTRFFKDVTTMFKSSEKDEEYYEDDAAPRKKSYSFMSAIFRRRIPSEEEIEMEIGTLDKEEKENLEKLEGTIEDAEEISEELEDEREGLMTRFFKLLRLYRTDEYADMEEDIPQEQLEPAVDEEMKETLKVLHYWLEQLPPEKKEQFKRSEDFLKYKNALRKMKLIKE